MACLAAWLKWRKGLGIAGTPGLMARALEPNPGETFEDEVKYQKQYQNGIRLLFGMSKSSLDENAIEASVCNLYEDLTRRMDKNTPGLGRYFDGGDGAGNSPAGGAYVADVAQAEEVGRKNEEAHSVQANPTVNNGGLRETVALVNAIKAGLSSMGAWRQTPMCQSRAR